MAYEEMPTDPGEIDKLEEEHLTKAQERASGQRERDMDENEKRTGLPGAIVRVESKKWTAEDPTYREVFLGEIAGHKLKITITGGIKKYGDESERGRAEVLAVVWGKGEDKDQEVILPQEEAEELWARLRHGVLVTEEEVQDDIKKIDAEKKAFLNEKLLSEIKKDFGI